MGISPNSCADEDLDRMVKAYVTESRARLEHLVAVAEDLEREYGIPIANKRVSSRHRADCGMYLGVDLTPLAHYA